MYLSLFGQVEVSVVIRQEGVVVLGCVDVHVSGVFERYERFLLQGFADEFDWVATPNLTLFYYPAGRDDAVGCDDRSLFDDCSFHDHRIVPDVDSALDSAAVQSAIILNDVVAAQIKLCTKAGGRGGSSV